VQPLPVLCAVRVRVVASCAPWAVSGRAAAVCMRVRALPGCSWRVLSGRAACWPA